MAIVNRQEECGGTLVSKDRDGEHLGYLAYSLRGGAIRIDSIGVHPRARRQGLATAMLSELQKEFPGLLVQVGYTTPDGEAWAQSVRSMLSDR